VLVLPLAALDVEVEPVFTAPEMPPAPELPEVADGLAVAFPVVVDPVEPVSPVMMMMSIMHVPVYVIHGAKTVIGCELWVTVMSMVQTPE